ncbi:conserved hypothetical protein [Thioalkalivibrio sulfidiphilus HL-EbGr7]|uniref:Phage protein n=1 Tax=Thioalkalivibrio sulfidiphilus (strain HL-EbGR7) TaxID=396588 RepID=B8GUY8_THISH|nr:hypothetical protein [Thioalkalivibrio sulfidiphilus]ACL71499.1 conserved hypothetical protein [Thioalkalivibrio sulfidiphilus HL-EbGr7]
MPTRTQAFRGFNDWIEVFRAGEHTDAAGNTRTWTEDDLDQIVRNHSEADAAPIVIGHPKTNDPAYGWTAALKREGGRLLARFKDVANEFAAAVEAGRYRKRSIRVAPSPEGWRLLHVGFLGAAPPAVSGLAALNYQEPEGEYHDYAADWYTPSVMARLMRRMRDFLIEHFGAEAADRVMPEGELDALKEHADSALEQSIGPEDEPTPAFAQSQTGDLDMPTQEDIERARREAREEAAAEFARRETELNDQLSQERTGRLRAAYETELRAHVDAGRLTPAQAEGAAEFMLALPDETFEFSSGEGDQARTEKKAPLDWFREFVGRLPKQVSLGEDGREGPGGAPDQAASFNAPQGYAVDGDQLELHRKALDYQKAHPGADYITAVRAVNES